MEDEETREETHTPPTEETHEETHTPPAHDHEAECRGRHSAMDERMSALESALQAVVQFKPDSTPVKRPWTHRGGR